MAVSEVLNRAHRFRDEIHQRTRAQQLAWLGKQLGIDDWHLLRLIGYRPATITRKLAEGATVEQLADAKPEGTLWVTELLREMASRSGYDVGRLAASFRQPPEDRITFQVTVPTSSGAKTRPAQRLQSLLLRQIHAGGPEVYSHLTEYLRLATPPAGGKKSGRRV